MFVIKRNLIQDFNIIWLNKLNNFLYAFIFYDSLRGIEKIKSRRERGREKEVVRERKRGRGKKMIKILKKEENVKYKIENKKQKIKNKKQKTKIKIKK